MTWEKTTPSAKTPVIEPALAMDLMKILGQSHQEHEGEAEEIYKCVQNPIKHFPMRVGGGGILTFFKIMIFFCLECFPKLTTGLSDERGGQGQLSTHTQGLIRREKLVEGGGGGKEG